MTTYCDKAKQMTYRSFKEAFEAWRKLSRSALESPTIYKCDKCLGWHFAESRKETFTR